MDTAKRPFSVIAFIINLAIPLTVGAIGAFLNQQSADSWYQNLSKPSFNPPAWLFAPVWTILYILIGIAAYRVWQKRHEISHLPRIMAFYFMQLLLNLFWTFLFFSAHKIGASAIEILALFASILVNAYVFYKIDKLAGLLFIPYAVWVSFASVLTYSIYTLN